MKKKIYWIILGFMLYAFFEVSSSSALFFLKKYNLGVYLPVDRDSLLSDSDRNSISSLIRNNDKGYIAYSSLLGWTVNKDVTGGTYRSNSQGIRSDMNYAPVPSDNIIRISSFGDSFTHCDEVKNEETWQEKMNSIGTNFEVINFGVPAFGLDQAFLRYQHDGAQYNSHIVFIGFLSENICRNVSVFRPFYVPWGPPLAKPRFIIKDNQLALIRNPVQKLSQYSDILNHTETELSKLGVYDYYFQTRYKSGCFDFLPSVRLIKMSGYKVYKNIKGATYTKEGYYDEDSEGYKVTVRIFDEFYDSAIRNNSLPIIILFPTIDDIIQYRKNKAICYEPLLKYFKIMNYQYIDLVDMFETDGREYEIRNLFAPATHYRPLTNELVAKYILAYMKEKKIVNQAKISSIIAELRSVKGLTRH